MAATTSNACWSNARSRRLYRKLSRSPPVADSLSPPPPFPQSAIDLNAQGLIGKPLDRIDGPLKVAGQAKYAYEYAGADQAAYGYIVGASIARGRIKALHTEAAEAMPGVLLVMTHRNAPEQPAFVPNDVAMPGLTTGRFGRPRPYLADDRVRYRGEPIALVVATQFEQAREAAARVTADYEEEEPSSDLAAALGRAYKPKTLNAGIDTDTAKGDFDEAYASAPVKIDVTYTTPYQNHNAMEPHATLASWDGDTLSIHSSCQIPMASREAIALTTGLPLDKVRVIAKFIGGGFGGKLATECDAILAAHAARKLRRPVKLAMTRQQTFTNTGHRPSTIQRVRFGASADGKLLATAHEVMEETSRYQEFAEQTAQFGRSLYAAPHRRTSHRLVRLDLPAPESMRAPGEAIGMLAYEAAFDELAHALGIDPIELRVRNEPKVDPESGLPFSTRNLLACLREGASRFGWQNRPTKPASRRENDWLIGYGMAAAIRPNYLQKSQARARIDTKGRVTVETAMTDIGTGTYTILAQIAAEALGVPVTQVTVEIGDSALPPAPGSGGSFGAASSGSAVLDACRNLRSKLAGLAGARDDDMRINGDRLVVAQKNRSLKTLMGREASVEAEGKVAPGAEQDAYSHAAYGAHFAEVAVDSITGEIRLRRMLGVFAAGRILNQKTARSQALGGLVWGLSSALHEETLIDHRYALLLNHDLAEYHVPVHADAVEIDAVFLDEPGDPGNPLRIKGVGELGICGAGAAINNAVFNATGVRVREYPITLDKLIAGLPPLSMG
ncbi:MAG: molybdopterin cofactor-binding domain-containing protein [Panacagrimonas sp.]